MKSSGRKIAFVLASSDHGTVIVNRFDYKMLDKVRGYGVGFQILEKSAFDPEEVELANSLLKLRRKYFGDGVVAIDCGANIGIHTIEWAKTMTGWGSVIAIEAQERIFYALAGNVAINNCLNAKVIFAAASAADGTMRVPNPDYLQPSSFGSLELKQRANTEFIGQLIDYAAEKTSEIRTLTLDSFELGRIDFIKIDVEGMELDVLEGAAQSITRNHPVLMVESIKTDKAKLQEWLQRKEYRTFDIGLNMLAVHQSDKTLNHVKSTPNVLNLKLSDSVTLAVPASLKSMTTYVLLEQETWFEKEMDFLRRWLRPGMTAIDIGANLGVYSLPMARLVSPSGHVFAYEPGSETRKLLERSRDLNEAVNLHILPFALSDREREGHLVFGGSSELNVLGDSGAGETVRITSLDIEDAARGWQSPDFVKIDAEGEEERIIAGGRNFFSRHSPLIMFEIKAGGKVNEQLRAIFPAIGYRLFRQLGGAPILVPADAQQPIDDYELNLFAAKPDRVRALSQQGLLVDAIPAWVPSKDDDKNADEFLRRQQFALLIDMSSELAAHADAEYHNSLTAYAVWCDADRPVATRCAALAFALQGLRAVCARGPTVGRLSTLARVAWEWGARAESVAALQSLLQALRGEKIRLNEPFWPASARFDSLAPGHQPADWFAGAAHEQFERSSGFSSRFTGASASLAWLSKQPFASAEIERRRVLIAARAGQQPTVPVRLCQPAANHLNAEIWRAGMVPGTTVRS
jgi:FkbM family methyltransferase